MNFKYVSIEIGLKSLCIFYQDPDFEPVDTCITSVLGSQNTIELTDEFKLHYDLWLQQEVFQHSVNWDEILQPGYM